MSAYIVDREHITYLVNCARHRGIVKCGNFSWYWNGQRYELPITGDPQRCSEVGQMLWDENFASVTHRYPDADYDELPGPIDTNRIYHHPNTYPHEMPEPIQCLSSIACLEYQSCEHPGWKDSQAYAFLRALEGACISSITTEAKWGWPKRQRQFA